jgi:hypothetical protein
MSPYVTKRVHQTRLMLDMCSPSDGEALTIYVPAANGQWTTVKPKCASIIYVDRDIRVNRKL